MTITRSYGTINLSARPGMWKEYYERKGRDDEPASLTLRLMFPIFRRTVRKPLLECCGLDLGAGNHRDAEVLLASGIGRMTTVDVSPDSRPYSDSLGLAFPGRLQAHIASFDEFFSFGIKGFDFAMSVFSIYMDHRPGHLEWLIHSVAESLAPGGIFAACFLSDKYRTGIDPYRFVSRDGLENIVKGRFDVIAENEFEGKALMLTGALRPQHFYNLVMIKRS